MDNTVSVGNQTSRDQDYVTDFWDTFSRDEQDALIREGFKAPNKRCELYVIDFVALKGLIYHDYI